MLSDNQNQPPATTQQDEQPIPQPYLYPQQLSQTQPPYQQKPQARGKMNFSVVVFAFSALTVLIVVVVLAIMIVLMVALNS